MHGSRNIFLLRKSENVSFLTKNVIFLVKYIFMVTKRLEIDYYSISNNDE